MAECDDRDSAAPPGGSTTPGSPRQAASRSSTSTPTRRSAPALIDQLATCGWVKAGHPLCLIGDSGTGKIAPADRPGHRRRRGRLPGQIHPRLEAGQRARRGRRRQAAVQDDRPIRPRRSALPGRAWIYGTRPARRRTAVPGFHRAGGEARPSRSRPTPRSAAGPRPSPIPGCAPRSWTGSPSPGRSSRPAPPATGSTPPPASRPPAAEKKREPRRVVNPLPRQ